MSVPARLPLFLLVKFPVLLFSLLLFAKLDFAVFPDAFPCIIYGKKETEKLKKKHLAYFSL